MSHPHPPSSDSALDSELGAWPVTPLGTPLRIGTLVAVVLALGVVAAGCTRTPVDADSPASGRVDESSTPSSHLNSDGTDSNVPEPTDDPASDAVREAVGAMSLEEKAASVMMIHFPGTDPLQFGEWMNQTGLAGIILMGDNTQGGSEATAELVQATKAASEMPLLIGIDQEGGIVSRLEDDPAAGPEALRDMDALEVFDQQYLRADYLFSLGINTNFGVVADITDDPGSFIWQRVLGTTPERAAEVVAASVEASQTAGVYATLKHFPGHGAAPGDSHHVIPQTDLALDFWRSKDAVPFEAGIEAGAALVMLGHLAFTSVSPSPASLAPEWVDILREELGFEGAIVTDDMRMLTDSGLPEYADGSSNVVDALRAGVDLILYVYPGGTDPVDGTEEIINAIVSAVQTGTLAEDRLTQAAERVMALRLNATP